jgi:hypothetical protein
LTRVDDHYDLVFLVHNFVRVYEKREKSDVVNDRINRRFPGSHITKPLVLKGFIMDFIAKAVYPWRTVLVITNPKGHGGAGNANKFNSFRKEIMISKSEG